MKNGVALFLIIITTIALESLYSIAIIEDKEFLARFFIASFVIVSVGFLQFLSKKEKLKDIDSDF